jgi:predicted Zn-dependent protease
VIARAAIVAVAVAAIVFMSIWLHDHNATISADHTLFDRTAKPTQLEHAISRAKSARMLNPSTEPDIAIYGLLVRLGRTAEARRVFESIVRREPDNRSAWSLLAVTTQASDPAQFRRALERLHELSPLTTRSP